MSTIWRRWGLTPRQSETFKFSTDPELEVKVRDVVFCLPRHRHQGVPRSLKQVAKASPRVPLHLVYANHATHKHLAVTAWLVLHPQITLHFTPTSGSWLNMVEIFFSIITRQAIRPGGFTSVKDLIEAIDGWNDRAHPFIWTKTASEVLVHCEPGQRPSLTRQ